MALLFDFCFGFGFRFLFAIPPISFGLAEFFFFCNLGQYFRLFVARGQVDNLKLWSL